MFGFSYEELVALVTSLGWLGPAFVTTFVVFMVVWQYTRRVFDDQVVYGINFIDHRSLQLRTVLTVPRDDIMTKNRIFQMRLRRAQTRCTPDDPFIRMSVRDHDALMPGIINGLSQKFAEGYMLAYKGQPVEKYDFLLAVVFETDSRMRVRMMRVIITDEEQLLQVKQMMADNAFVERLATDRPHHTKRMETMEQIAKLWEKEKSYPAEKVRLIQRFQAVVPKGEQPFAR